MDSSCAAPPADCVRACVKPLSRIFLRDGALTVGVAPDCGGALTRFDVRVGETLVDILRQAIDGTERSVCALGTSCFPLVPYGGRLRGGRFSFGGRPYRFPLNALPERHSSHGDGWTRPWDLVHLDRRTAVMSLEADVDAPLRYSCTQTVAVRADGLRITLSVRNVGPQSVPMGLGLHPYFADRNRARVTANLPIHWRWDAELMPVDTERNPLVDAFCKGTDVAGLPVAAEYAGWDGSATIEWPDRRVRVELDTLPRLRHVVMWVPRGESFFCFEPICHATDALNPYPDHPAAEDFLVLEPNDTFEQCFDFQVSIL